MEPFYGFTREIDLRDAGSSIVAFEEWLELGRAARPEATHLERIERYNRDDVVSNHRLRDWLETCRVELAAARPSRSRARRCTRVDPLPAEPESRPRRRRSSIALARPRRSGLRGPPIARAARSLAARAAPRLASARGQVDVVGFHRLRHRLTEQLVDEDEPIGMLEPIGPGEETKARPAPWRYAFPPQDSTSGRQCNDPRTRVPARCGRCTEVVDLAAHHGRLGPLARAPHPPAIVLNWVRDRRHRGIPDRDRGRVADHGIGVGAGRDVPSGPRPAPRPTAAVRRRRRGELLRAAGETDLEAAAGWRSPSTTEPCDPGPARHRQDVQRGPDDPDARRRGQAGRHHGDEPQGHRQPARRRPRGGEGDGRRTATGDRIVIGQKPAGDEVPACAGAEPLGPRPPSRPPWQRHPRCRRGHGVAVGHARHGGRVDVLFVDEAGQFASPTSSRSRPPTARSCCSATRSSSTSRSRAPTRPARSGARWPISSPAPGRAAARTMPPDRGLFLETTWRLHPSICAFTRELFYASQLHPMRGLRTRRSRRTAAARPTAAARSARPAAAAPAPAPSRRERHPLASRRARRQRHPIDRGGRGDRRARP